ncbi:MAG: calcium-binding protein, partial [Mycobacterium sp.]|nr:calcium-binding protein [Mycobacterium sp.]
RAATTTAASAAAPATQAETAQAETAQAETPADSPAEVAIEEAPVIATTTEAVAPLPVPAG